MRSKRSPLPDFEACSLVLFTLLAAGASLPPRAQTPLTGSTNPGLSRTPAVSARSLHARALPASSAHSCERLSDAARRTDADRIGEMSSTETLGIAPRTRRFARIDANQDAANASPEFVRALS